MDDCLRLIPNDDSLMSGHLSVELVSWLAQCVFRTDLHFPGFACLQFTGMNDSPRLRHIMVQLKEALSRHFEDHWNEPLDYYSLGRFDQKKSTRLHLDGGPACSFLMLGYEPSLVTSRFLIADFSRLAAERNCSGRQLLDLANPMFDESARQDLEPYTQEVPAWDDSLSRIVIVNNSVSDDLSPALSLPSWGVLHGAEILDSAGESCRRVINSTMFVPASQAPAGTEEAEHIFLTTQAISGLLF